MCTYVYIRERGDTEYYMVGVGDNIITPFIKCYYRKNILEHLKHFYFILNIIIKKSTLIQLCIKMILL